MIVGLGRKTMFTHCAGQVYFGAALITDHTAKGLTELFEAERAAGSDHARGAARELTEAREAADAWWNALLQRDRDWSVTRHLINNHLEDEDEAE
jgi:hypothetical protein